jgi:acetaldehyde dehydrogenase
MAERIRVAILGTGNIGSDLAERLLVSEDFHLVAVAGRRPESAGLARLLSRVELVSSSGLEGLRGSFASIQGFFDATSANDHPNHWLELEKEGKWVIDLTPSKIGKATVPVLANRYPELGYAETQVANYSMVTCGGQSSAPIIAALAEASKGVAEVEVSSSISSDSAGPATRRNIDHYVESTENLAGRVAGTDRTKAILVLNPAEPPPLMRTTVTLKAEAVDMVAAIERTSQYVASTRDYVPGYELVIEPHFVAEGILSATVSVKGEGYFLPPHAGNLDIINAAAIEVARRHSARHPGGRNG